MQQIKRSGGVARGQTDLGEAQEIGGDELMLFDLASKDEFKDLARGLLVAGPKQPARGGAQNLRSRRSRRIRAILGEFRV